MTFSHPDYTVGPGVAPDLPGRACSRARGLYRRSGIAGADPTGSPCPEGLLCNFAFDFSLASPQNGGKAADPGGWGQSGRHRPPDVRTSRAVGEGQPPPREAFTRRERAIIEAHRTPRQVERYLRSLRYNHERVGATLRSFREIVRVGEVHCLEAALAATVIMEQHGYPPIVMSFESQDDLDHVIFVFRHRGRWGSVARSRDAGLHGRRPVFRSIRDLAWSYYDPYVDFTGRLTGYALVDLRELGSYDWRLSRRNMWKLERFLIDYPHRRMRSSRARYRRLLRAFRAFRRRHPSAPAVYYRRRERWM